LIGVAGGMGARATKTSGKVRYLRDANLNLLCNIHWIRGSNAPIKKKNTRV